MQVIAHGGAGGSPSEPDARQSVLDEAAADGAAAETPVEAVEAAIARLESSPRFNAGVGSAVQSDGRIRVDAGIMTSDREAGAACSMIGVENAISVARVVMEETPHVLVSCEQATALAEAFGIETGVDLFTEDRRESWASEDAPDGSIREQLEWVRGGYSTETDGARDHDTVGAVASDGERIAAATSTGGRWGALAGRVGDVPQIGSGFFATEAAGASATGVGEEITKTTLTARAVRKVEDGVDPDAAAESALDEFADLTGSVAGLVVMDRDGGVGSAFNSASMQTAVAGE